MTLTAIRTEFGVERGEGCSCRTCRRKLWLNSGLNTTTCCTGQNVQRQQTLTLDWQALRYLRADESPSALPAFGLQV